MIKEKYIRANGLTETQYFESVEAQEIWERNNKDRLSNGIYSKCYARPTKKYYVDYEELKEKILERLEQLNICKVETNKYIADISVYCKCNIADTIICLLEIYE